VREGALLGHAGAVSCEPGGTRGSGLLYRTAGRLPFCKCVASQPGVFPVVWSRSAQADSSVEEIRLPCACGYIRFLIFTHVVVSGVFGVFASFATMPSISGAHTSRRRWICLHMGGV
jgi:hypothetical protein